LTKSSAYGATLKLIGLSPSRDRFEINRLSQQIEVRIVIVLRALSFIILEWHFA